MLALVAGLVFYGLNLHKTISSLKRIAIDAAGATLDLGEPALWKKQKKWLNDSRVCPACGEPKNTYSYKCINCGIYFTKPGKQKPTEVVSSSIKGITIHYQLSKKNAKDCC